MNRKRKFQGQTEIRNEDGTYLCPVCINNFRQVDMIPHHVHWFADGGNNLKFNVLFICQSCHGKITMGTVVDRVTCNALCNRYMIAEWGLLYLLPIFEKQERHRIFSFFVEHHSDEMAKLTLSDIRGINRRLKTHWANKYHELSIMNERDPEFLMEYFGIDDEARKIT